MNRYSILFAYSCLFIWIAFAIFLQGNRIGGCSSWNSPPSFSTSWLTRISFESICNYLHRLVSILNGMDTFSKMLLLCGQYHNRTTSCALNHTEKFAHCPQDFCRNISSYSNQSKMVPFSHYQHERVCIGMHFSSWIFFRTGGDFWWISVRSSTCSTFMQFWCMRACVVDASIQSLTCLPHMLLALQ